MGFILILQILMEKYLKHNGNPVLAENLNMINQELKEVVKQFDEEKKNNTNNNLKESNNTLSQIESITIIKIKKFYLN